MTMESVPDMTSGITVSVIIPTYQNWDALRLCVRALSKQTYPQNLFEVIVVNNDPDAQIPKEFISLERFKFITESNPGSYAARNAGIRMASGTVLAFTDSDCIPDYTWVENGVKVLERNPAGRVAGNISLFYRKPGQLTPAELYEKVFAFNQASNTRFAGFSVTANMFTWKHVLENTGYFNEKMLSGGDFEWAIRANALGYNIIFGETANVSHPARHKVSELIEKARRVSGGHVYLYNKNLRDAVTGIIKAAKPPFFAIKHIRENAHDLSLSQKWVVFLLRYYLNQIGAWETLFVIFGKSPQRK